MPFDNPVSALRDIADAIDSIKQFTEGMDFEAFTCLDLKECEGIRIVSPRVFLGLLVG